jgi:hypothetical protein
MHPVIQNRLLLLVLISSSSSSSSSQGYTTFLYTCIRNYVKYIVQLFSYFQDETCKYPVEDTCLWQEAYSPTQNLEYDVPKGVTVIIDPQ